MSRPLPKLVAKNLNEQADAVASFIRVRKKRSESKERSKSPVLSDKAVSESSATSKVHEQADTVTNFINARNKRAAVSKEPDSEPSDFAARLNETASKSVNTDVNHRVRLAGRALFRSK